LHQEVEHGHREGQPTAEGCPCPMTELLEPTHGRQHRQHGFHHHALVPGAAFAGFHIGGVTRLGVEARISQNNHLVFKLSNQPVKGGVRHMRGGIIPRDDQSPLVDDVGELRPDDPAVVRYPFRPDLPVGPVFTLRMAQFDAVTISDT
jgi:hypothetical protein